MGWEDYVTSSSWDGKITKGLCNQEDGKITKGLLVVHVTKRLLKVCW